MMKRFHQHRGPKFGRTAKLVSDTTQLQIQILRYLDTQLLDTKDTVGNIDTWYLSRKLVGHQLARGLGPS